MYVQKVTFDFSINDGALPADYKCVQLNIFIGMCEGDVTIQHKDWTHFTTHFHIDQDTGKFEKFGRTENTPDSFRFRGPDEIPQEVYTALQEVINSIPSVITAKIIY